MLKDSTTLILIVQDAGLRSMLAARLTLTGAELITARNISDPALLRGRRRPAILVVDEGEIGHRSDEWMAALLDDPSWRTVVVLTRQAMFESVESTDPRLRRVPHTDASDAIAQLLDAWKAELAS